MSKSKKLTKIFKKFGISKVKKGENFEYNFENNVITFCPTVDSIADRHFTEFIAERFGYKKDYPFALSLLHEVGHSKNNEEIVDNIYAFCIGEKFKIQKALNKTADDDNERIKELDYRYFNLPDEIMATAWAVNYAGKHPKQVKKIEQVFREG